MTKKCQRPRRRIITSMDRHGHGLDGGRGTWDGGCGTATTFSSFCACFGFYFARFSFHSPCLECLSFSFSYIFSPFSFSLFFIFFSLFSVFSFLCWWLRQRVDVLNWWRNFGCDKNEQWKRASAQHERINEAKAYFGHGIPLLIPSKLKRESAVYINIVCYGWYLLKNFRLGLPPFRCLSFILSHSFFDTFFDLLSF